MKQFGGVGPFALDPKQNFERRGSSRRNSHRSLLSQMVAGFGSVAVDEFLGAHASPALELNFDQLQRRVMVFVPAAANQETRSLDCDFSGRKRDRRFRRVEHGALAASYP